MKSSARHPLRSSVIGWLAGLAMVTQAASPDCLRSIARELLTLNVTGCQTLEDFVAASRQLVDGDEAGVIDRLRPSSGAFVLEATLVRREILLTASDEWASPEPFSNAKVYRLLLSKGERECWELRNTRLQVIHTPKCCDVSPTNNLACHFDLLVVKGLSEESPAPPSDQSGSMARSSAGTQPCEH